MKTIEEAREWLATEVQRRELELFAYGKALELANKNQEAGFLILALNHHCAIQKSERVKDTFSTIIQEMWGVDYRWEKEEAI